MADEIEYGKRQENACFGFFRRVVQKEDFSEYAENRKLVDAICQSHQSIYAKNRVVPSMKAAAEKIVNIIK